MSADGEVPAAAPEPQPQPKSHVPPPTSIRAPAPKPKQLSRKVLITGSLIIAGVVVFTLFSGLSERGRGGPRNEAMQQQIHAATPPETVRVARAEYSADDLRPPADEGHDYFWGGNRPTEFGSHEANAAHGYAPPVPARPSPAEMEAEAALSSSIAFGRRGARGAGSGAGDVADVGQRSAFLASQRGRDDGVLDAEYRPPRSPYTIQAGSTISAALVTGLNSAQPGRVVARVTENVYDSVTGEHLLIPQGATLLGTYDSNNSYGDRRLLVVWNRLVMPNGWSIALRGMPGTERTGAAGLRGRVNNHLGRIAVASLLSGALSAAANEVQDNDNQRLMGSVGDAAAQEAARVGARIVDRELSVRPTIEVPQAERIAVLVSQDIILRPYTR